MSSHFLTLHLVIIFFFFTFMREFSLINQNTPDIKLFWVIGLQNLIVLDHMKVQA